METLNGHLLDPYLDWLDVRSTDRPLNAYQLLGLTPGEATEAGIEEALRNKRDLLRRHVPGGRPALVQHLHRELNEAAETLLDPRKKAAYDRRLFPLGPRHLAEPQGPLTCGDCGETNPPQRVFCFQCGQALLEPCARCGTKVAASEPYCGVCGANIEAALKERFENFEARLQEAETLQNDGHFDAALVLLSSMLSTSHARLEELVERAQEMLRQLPKRSETAAARCRVAVEKAEALAEACDWEEAVALLESTPPGLRTEQTERRLAAWRLRRDEAAQLTREIRTAVMARQTDDLLPKVERLLELKPTNAQARKLREQLLALRQKTEAKTAEELRRQARQLLAEHHYARALKLLEETPDTARDEGFRKLYEFARETAWLANSLTVAPIVDRGLLAAAQRLCKLSPTDTQAALALQQIEAALKKGPQAPRHAAPAWRDASPQMPLRFPVTWLGGFRRIGLADALDPAALRQAPGRFYVACGLALQGLELAAVPTNLAPKKKKGVLDSLTLFGRKRETADAAWGIDVSLSGVKAIRLSRANEAVEIAAVELIERPFDGVAPGDEEKILQALRESLEQFVARRNLEGERVCVALGGVPMLARFFPLPVVEGAKLPEVVRFEVRHQIPVPLEELAWDFHAFPVSLQEAGRAREQEIVVLAAKRHQLQHPVGPLEACGAALHAIQHDGTALYNFLSYELHGHFPGADSASASAWEEERVIVVIDLGREVTNFLACSPGSMWFRAIPIGGDRFTKALVREFQLTFAEAEQLKRAPWKARSLRQWDEALLPTFSDLVEEVRRTEAMLARRRRIERLYVTGGGAALHGLVRRLRHAALDREEL